MRRLKRYASVSGWVAAMLLASGLVSSARAESQSVVDRVSNTLVQFDANGSRVDFQVAPASGSTQAVYDLAGRVISPDGGITRIALSGSIGANFSGAVVPASNPDPVIDSMGAQAVTGAVGTFISATGCVDMAYNDLNGILYISCSNSILRYRLSSQSFLSPIVLGGTLGGIDSSPDGKSLVVVDQSSSPTQNWVYVVQVASGTTQQIKCPLAFGEAGMYSAVYASDGSIWMTSQYAGSGWVPMRRYDPATSNTITIASVRQNSMLTASATHDVIAYEESNISSGPAGKYDTRTRVLMGSVGTGQFLSKVGVSRDGSQLAVPGGSGTLLYDELMRYQATLGSSSSDRPVDVVFHPTRDGMFAAWQGTREVRLYDWRSLQLAASFDVGYTFSSSDSSGYSNGRVRISADGHELFVKVNGGIRYVHVTTTIPEYRRLVVDGVPGRYANSTPLYGTNWVYAGAVFTNSVASTAEYNQVRFRCAGWTGTGDIPVTGTTNRLICAISNDSSLAWQWAPTEVYLTLTTVGGGSINATNGWRPYGASIQLTATPGTNNFFLRWDGNVPAGSSHDTTILVPMDQARMVYAVFGINGNEEGTLPGDWPTYGNGASHSGHFPGFLSSNIFSQKWVKAISGSLNQVAVGGGRIFVTPWQYFGTAFLDVRDEATGNQIWKYNFASCYSINPPTYDNNCVYVQRGNHGSDTHIWCFDASTGSNLWRTAHSAQWERYMAPTVAEHKIWVNGGYYGGMYGFNQDTGAMLFSLGLEQYDGWTPTYLDGNLYSWVAGHFRQHNLSTGTVLWDLNIGWSWSGWTMGRTIAASQNFAYCIGNSSEIYGIDLVNQRLSWRVSGAYSGTPAVADGTVYAIRGTVVDALSAQTGTLLGSYSAGSSLTGAIIVTDDALIVGSADKTFVFELRSFVRRQTIPHGGWLSLANSVLYIAKTDGNLYAFQTAPWTTSLIVKSNTGLAGAPVPYYYGTNTVAVGSNFTEQVVSPAYVSNETRYVCTGWSGAGDVPSSGTNCAVSLVLTNASTLIWNWRKEHTACWTATNGIVLAFPQEGWATEGYVYAAVPSNYYGFAFDHWVVNGTNAGTAVPLSITIRGPVTVVPVFTPTFIDVTSEVTVSVSSWRFDLQTGTFKGSLILSNSVSSHKSLIAPFWYLVQTTPDQRLMHPDGVETNSGFPYLDVTSQISTQLPGIGNGNQSLDPGESVVITGIEFYSRYRTVPSGYIWGVWADPPGVDVSGVATLDTDGDGMPDAWESVHPLLSVHNPDDGVLDSDGDGVCNRDEYEADTNPEDPGSCLRVLQLSSSVDALSLVWQGGVMSTQIVEVSEDLGKWVQVGIVVPPCTTTNTLRLPASQGGRYVRVRSAGRTSR